MRASWEAEAADFISELVEAVAMSTAQLSAAADLIYELASENRHRRVGAACKSQCDFNRAVIAKAKGGDV